MVFRYLVGNWLRNEAARRAREAVVEAAKSQAQPHPEQQPSAEPPPPVEIGLVFALAMEAGGVVERLDAAVTTRGSGFVSHEGALCGQRVAVIVSGTGREKAANAASALIAAHHPRWIVSAGFAGGLASELKLSDILMVSSVATPSGEPLSIDVKIEPAGGLHVGRLLTVDQIVRTPSDKRALGESHNALAVDMETFGVAEVCQREKVRLICVRTISDTVDDELPADVQYLLDQESLSARLGAATGSLWRRPASAKDLWKLREDALVASERLAKFLTGIVEQLAATP